jgi:hypothetical protein
MLGTLLGTLQPVYPHDFLDEARLEDENEDNHWASDKNRFEDWFLHGDAVDAARFRS